MQRNGSKKNGKRRDSLDGLDARTRKLRDELIAKTVLFPPRGGGLESGELPREGWGLLHEAAMHGIGPETAGLAPLAGGNFTAKPPEKVETVPTERKTPQLHP